MPSQNWAKQYRDENKETETNQSESATGKIEEIDDIGYDEDPVSLFSPKNNMFDGNVLSRKHKKGDRRFNVYGHGETTFLFDEDGRFPGIKNADDFDTMMKALNDQWDNSKDNKNTVLSLWSCKSGSVGKDGLSLAQMISKKHPNIIVIGGDGYFNYVKIKTKIPQYRIAGVDIDPNSGKNDGKLVAYKNGIRIYRETFKRH